MNVKSCLPRIWYIWVAQMKWQQGVLCKCPCWKSGSPSHSRSAYCFDSILRHKLVIPWSFPFHLMIVSSLHASQFRGATLTLELELHQEWFTYMCYSCHGFLFPFGSVLQGYCWWRGQPMAALLGQFLVLALFGPYDWVQLYKSSEVKWGVGWIGWRFPGTSYMKCVVDIELLMREC